MAVASRTARALAVAFAVLCALLPASAGAAERVTLSASFSPDRLDTPTTVHFGFTISTAGGGVPSALTHIALRIPAGMSYARSGLGSESCAPQTLLEEGLRACPRNSRIGFGSAYVEVPFGPGAGYETPRVQALMGPPHGGNVVVLFYVNGLEPVMARLVFAGELLPASGPFGSSLDVPIPLVPSIAGGPPVSILRTSTTIGPAGLTYYRHVHGRLVRFHPRGMSVPLTCPRGGFPFAGDFTFQDGSTVTASTTVPCPRRRA